MSFIARLRRVVITIHDQVEQWPPSYTTRKVCHSITIHDQVAQWLACERKRISGCRDSLRRKRENLRRRESRQPEIRLRSQATQWPPSYTTRKVCYSTTSHGQLSSRTYTTRWIILFGTISHGHELRTMFEFSFIPADSEGLSVSRPARDQQHSALRSRTQFPQTSINATDEAFYT